MKPLLFIFLFILPLAIFAQQNDNKVQTDTIAVGQVVINELLAINTTTMADPYGEFDDWIELYNNTSNTISLDHVFLSDSYNNPLKWQFPLGTTINGNAYVIVWCDGDTTEMIGFHTPFKLSGAGEKAILSYANGKIIDSVRFGQQTADISWGRYPNGTGPFMFLTPTFAASNSPLNIAEQGKETFSIFPNPAKDLISINTGTDEIIKARLFNTDGQIILQSSSKIIDIRNISEGIYYLSIITNRYTAVKKITIAR